MRELLRKAARSTFRRLLGPPARGVVDELAHHHKARFDTFVAAAEYLNFEEVPGDVLEFGVFTGASLALLAKAFSFDPKGMERRIAGFDSFTGLPGSAEIHVRWQPGDCATNHAWHPLLPVGAPVTPQVTFDLFRACGLPDPELEIGPFEETLPACVPAKYRQVALVHVDCDLYESTRELLARIAPALSDGAVVLFDDWFHYKGNPGKGEARAFAEFLETHPEWGANPYRPYATFCNSFILYRR